MWSPKLRDALSPLLADRQLRKRNGSMSAEVAEQQPGGHVSTISAPSLKDYGCQSAEQADDQGSSSDQTERWSDSALSPQEHADALPVPASASSSSSLSSTRSTLTSDWLSSHSTGFNMTWHGLPSQTLSLRPTACPDGDELRSSSTPALRSCLSLSKSAGRIDASDTPEPPRSGRRIARRPMLTNQATPPLSRRF